MTDLEINTFIRTMEEYGDSWTYSEVFESKYADMDLESAINNRLSECSWLSDILVKASGLL
ncbi:hypothetical protein [uncultured Eubacterium sp.]|uniref:hypothetical protein n=1 Tax=uncultured Eubacterium sp. TaxID=165185 RepID=UPI0025924F3B|nr:hypothetical protein [uncultured Eubacterium sp.]